MKIPNFSPAVIEHLARTLGDEGTGGEISQTLARLNINDESGHSTKWRRLDWVFNDAQRRNGCANEVLQFIRSFVPPDRYAGRSDEFERLRRALNTALSFEGYEYLEDGEFREVRPATTPSEAEIRYDAVCAKLAGRNIHEQALKYCRADLMQEDYFDAVFEACKGLMQRIREMSGVDADGAQLVQHVFSGKQPKLAFNTLRTELEWGDQRGFAKLLEGCMGAIRNRLAHQPKILWEGVDDAADYLTLISLLHRKLDAAIPVRAV